MNLVLIRGCSNSWVKKEALFLVSMAALLLVLCLPCLSCQSESGSIPGWSADGVIGDAEYDNTADYAGGIYHLYWSSDEQYIYMGIKVETEGFVAVGFSTSGMLGADCVFGFVKDGQASVLDVHLVNYYGPHPEDTADGGSNDILESGGTEGGGYTTIEFKRALDTGDQYDKAIIPGEDNTIIWSYGTKDVMTDIHVQMGSASIQP
jgi:hypothetical protein